MAAAIKIFLLFPASSEVREEDSANSNPELIDYKLIEDGNNFSSSFVQLKLLVLSATLNNRLINDNLMLAI